MRPSWFQRAPGFDPSIWSAGWSDATGPDFRAPATSGDHRASVEALTRAAGLSGAAWTEQVHGDRVLRVDAPGPAKRADALWTDVPGLGVIGRSADCPLILAGGETSRGAAVWGFAHASWRSTVAGIAESLVRALLGGGAVPESLQATICPSAGPCCYEVGEEVRTAALHGRGDAAAAHFQPHGDRWILDLWAANRAQLVEAGVAAGAIRIDGTCTICSGGRYPSHRRDGIGAGRFAAIIGPGDS